MVQGWRWLGPRHDRTSWTQLCFVQGGLTGCCCAASQALPTGLPSSRPLPNHSSWRMTSTWTLSQPLQTTSQVSLLNTGGLIVRFFLFNSVFALLVLPRRYLPALPLPDFIPIHTSSRGVSVSVSDVSPLGSFPSS